MQTTTSAPTAIPEGKYLDIGEISGLPQRIHYHEQGEGEVVIFLHGAGGGGSGHSHLKGNLPGVAEAGWKCRIRSRRHPAAEAGVSYRRD